MSSMLRIGAIEAGGTKMVLAIGNAEGSIFEREVLPTEEPEKVVPKIIKWFQKRDISALGVGAFGPTGVNPKLSTYGKILATPKRGWEGYDFLQALSDGLHVPIGFDTDVNAACLGEATYGAAKELDNVVYLTVGTGIGAGVLVNGELLHGMLHPEAGHVPIEKEQDDSLDSVCPYHESCLEGLASGPSIQKRWGLSAVELAEKDEVWDLESTYLAKALAIYVLTYSPQRIILGGGVMNQRQLFPLIRKKLLTILNGYISTSEIQNVNQYVVESGCKGDQGILGALALGVRSLTEKI